MCTVTDFDCNSGFTVHLDEYDLNGLLVLRELHNKKIRVPLASFLKVGTQLSLMVIDAGSEDGPVYVSKKIVKSDQIKACKLHFQLNNRLFNLVKRLPNDNWMETFQALNGPGLDKDDHPWTLLNDREWGRLEDLTEKEVTVLKEHHSKLFGIKPQSVRAKFTVYSFAIEGNNLVRDLLISVQHKWHRPTTDEDTRTWTQEELYVEGDRCNVSIQPIAIPTFQLKVTAYDRQRCYDVISTIKGTLEATDTGLDHVAFEDAVWDK
jgi:translation initiation factor 2 alpha subunit (eIF-2alpha)